MPVPTPGSSVFVQSRDLVLPPKNDAGNYVAMHYQVVPTNADPASLETWMIAAGYTDGIPLRATNPPSAVTFQIESGATGKVWVALIANADSSLGLQIPVAPAVMRIPGREFLRNDLLSLIGDQGGGTAVQVFFEWLSENA